MPRCRGFIRGIGPTRGLDVCSQCFWLCMCDKRDVHNYGMPAHERELHVHARPQGWVALSGLEYGADPLLYQAHPADLCVRVLTHSCHKSLQLHRLMRAARPQGWVALSGLKYGADLVLYQAHPADCHADFCAIALPAEPPPQGSPGSPNLKLDPGAPHAGSTHAGAGSSSSAADAAQGGGYGPGGAACDTVAGHGEVDKAPCPAQALANGHSSYACSAGTGALDGHGVHSGRAVNDTHSSPAAASSGAGSAGAAPGSLAPDAAAAAKEGENPKTLQHRLRLGSRALTWNDLEAANRLCTQVHPST